jgi:hypothetical protein
VKRIGQGLHEICHPVPARTLYPFEIDIDAVSSPGLHQRKGLLDKRGAVGGV